MTSASLTAADLTAMGPGSQVLATFPDGSQPPVTIIRTGASYGGAASDGYMLAGTQQWLEILAWGATLTPIYDATPQAAQRPALETIEDALCQALIDEYGGDQAQWRSMRSLRRIAQRLATSTRAEAGAKSDAPASQRLRAILGEGASEPTDGQAEAAARAIDPDAWNLHPAEFEHQNGQAPAWSDQHQERRRAASLEKARSALTAAMETIR